MTKDEAIKRLGELIVEIGDIGREHDIPVVSAFEESCCLKTGQCSFSAVGYVPEVRTSKSYPWPLPIVLAIKAVTDESSVPAMSLGLEITGRQLHPKRPTKFGN